MIIYGIRPVEEALRSQARNFRRIWIPQGTVPPRLRPLLSLARQQGVPVLSEPGKFLKRKAGGGNHQGIVAELDQVHYLDWEELLAVRPRLLLMVDSIEDPHNLGSVLRTAEATGVDGVLLPKRRTCGVTSAVIRSSAGAALHLKIARCTNVVRTLERFKQERFWVVGLDPAGQDSVQAIDTQLNLVVVVGGEHRGIRRLVREQCDYLVSLPMLGKVESLNLSVAASVLLYQILLQRLDTGESRPGAGGPKREAPTPD